MPAGRARAGQVRSLFALLALAGCGTSFRYIPDAATLEPQQSPFADEAMPRVELVKSACYGTCPSYHLTVWENGLVVFGFGTIPGNGLWWRSIPPAQAKALLRGLENVEDIPCGSEGGGANDAQRIDLTVRRGAEACRRSYLGGSNAPPKFLAAVSSVLDATGARSLSHE